MISARKNANRRAFKVKRASELLGKASQQQVLKGIPKNWHFWAPIFFCCI